MSARARILIVEDESMVADDLHLRLERLGFDVIGIRDTAASAVAAATELSPDLVLLDIRLKGTADGVEVARRLRERNVGFVFLTAHADRETLLRTGVTEPLGYIVKPFEERGLNATIAMALNRHHAEQRQRQLQHWLATTLRSIGDAVITTDACGSVTYVNPVAAQLLGVDVEAVVGRPVADVFVLVQGTGLVREACPVALVLANGVSVWLQDDVWLQRRDGTRVPIEDCASPIRDDDGRLLGAVVIFRDASQRRQLVAEQQRVAKRLLDAERLRGLGVLAGGLAHDFNNILTSILGNVAQSEDSDVSTTERLRSLAAIKSAALTAADICRQMMDTAGIGRVDLQALDLSAVTLEVVRVIAAAVPRAIALQVEAPRTLPAVIADRRQLGQVLTNLILNAAEAIGERGGAIQVRTGLGRESAAALEATIGSPQLPGGDYGFVEVADDGPGMTAEIAAQIFEPFFTTKFAGRGLGLAGVLGIVRRHHGAIALTTAPGRGAAFRVLLPVGSPAESLAVSAPPRPAPVGTVVVIDDDPGIRELLLRWFSIRGRQCVVADGVESGFLACVEHAEQVAAVVLDLTMPDGSGTSLLARLRQRWPNLPVVVISGLAPPAGLLAQARVEFLAKPFALGELDAALERLARA
ncbi:MAG: response regulator [Planctomycetes bacterium]|nr:response regulator [Planctomycetota bacterium]